MALGSNCAIHWSAALTLLGRSFVTLLTFAQLLARGKWTKASLHPPDAHSLSQGEELGQSRASLLRLTSQISKINGPARLTQKALCSFHDLRDIPCFNLNA